jgi:DNA-binding response OmpR family regulator
MTRILVVEDDDTVAEVVESYLRAAGMTVVRCEDGASAVATAVSTTPDLVVLDVMLPGIDGIEVLRRLRQQAVSAPVIMLTALVEEDDRIRGLEVGADDYLTKPFSPRELVLRVQSVLRRTQPDVAPYPAPEQSAVLHDGDLVVDTLSRKVELGGRPVPMTLREFDLLAYLLANPNRVLSRETLLGAVWGWDVGDPSTVTVHVRRLREKVEPSPQAPTRIVTVWGRGYRWEPAQGVTS